MATAMDNRNVNRKIVPARPGAPLPGVRPKAKIVRVAKGSRPAYSGLNSLQAMAWRHFKDRAIRNQTFDTTLDDDLMKSHMRLRGTEYMAYVYFVTWMLALPIGIAIGVVLGIMALFFLGLSLVLAIVFAVLPAVFIPILAYVMIKGAPGSRAKSRGRLIDKKISSGMSFISAMASADVNIDTIFKELGKEKIYGEFAEEAAWITRDTELLGVDILTSIRRGATRTPSRRMQDFLQGVVTTATTGGQLKPYFLIKAEQYERENKLDLAKRIETMGLMAETFVTVVVAFPLFLVVMIAIFAVVGSNGMSMMTVLWAIVGLMLPALQGVFIWLMLVMSKEGQS
jgi:flagellar protein FlaJ